MKSKEEIKELLKQFQKAENRELTFDEEAIFAVYQKNNGNQSLAIKVLSVFGGILASIAFLAFIFVVGLYDSNVGLILFGITSIITGIFISKIYDKIIIDTISVSSYIIGFILLAIGLFEIEMSEETVSFIFILIAISSLFIAQNYIISFISVLIINGAILNLIRVSENFDLIHIYTSVIAILITFFFLKESKIITANDTFSKLYNPVRTGLVFSFLAGLIILGKSELFDLNRNDLWISSVVIILAIIYLLPYLFEVFNISQTNQKAGVYMVSIIILLPTLFSPAISGAILIILLSFLVNYKTGLVLGIIAFIYFVSQYYYDLHFTLLTKSIVLFSSGLLFIGIYLLTHKKLKSNEKI